MCKTILPSLEAIIIIVIKVFVISSSYVSGTVIIMVRGSAIVVLRSTQPPTLSGTEKE